jgi:hypothetical protein
MMVHPKIIVLSEIGSLWGSLIGLGKYMLLDRRWSEMLLNFVGRDKKSNVWCLFCHDSRENMNVITGKGSIFRPQGHVPIVSIGYLRQPRRGGKFLDQAPRAGFGPV